MEIEKFLNNPRLWEIVSQYNDTKVRKEQNSYNLFTISSYNSYLENFHSDIIASLLDPLGLHQQGYTFLHLFIQYLNKYHNVNISNNDFLSCKVSRETGRLDIWIRDVVSNQSIIIENKINNAQDMEDQIIRYSEYSETNNFRVKVIVYLSLDGNKKAPATNDKLDAYVKNIGAFTNSENDLVHGWLHHCLENQNNHDSFSVIHQYIKLIKHLANHNMDATTLESYYQFLSTENGFEIAKTIVEMSNKITSFRANKFGESIINFKPFMSPCRYKPECWLYQDYVLDHNSLKLDVWFYSDGSASVIFWNTTTQNITGRDILTRRLTEINLLDKFEDVISNGGNGYRKDFVINNTYMTINEVDKALSDFVNRLMSGLRTA